VVALKSWFCLRFLEFSRNRLAAHGVTHIFLGLRMNYLAVGQEPPGIELLLLFSFGFDWFVSNVRYLD